MKLRLKKFNVRSIKSNSVVVLIGKRCTGKSTLTKDILYHHQDIPAGTVISGTESANGFFGKFVPKILIHDEYKATISQDFAKRQKGLMVRKEAGETDIDERAFFVMDDCLYDDGSWKKDKNIRWVFMNGRHYGILFIITMQYPLGIGPNLRTNIDYVFILRENIVGNRRRIYENYAGMFQTFEIFQSIMDQCTEDFECLVIHNNAKSNKIEDQVFWYKAEPHDDFRLCEEEVWQFSEKFYRNKEDDEEDLNTYQKKRSVNLKVNKI
jgi:hypothetical protein